jgi:C-3',4' desaturase CrtD
MGSLAAAAWLAAEGRDVMIAEQNYLPGGCTSSYFRKGFIFEAGATTLVGLDKGMPLELLLQKTGIKLDAIKLKLPMQVMMQDGSLLNRYQDLNQWIDEAERYFGKKGQRIFWEKCYQISQFVWSVSGKQMHFPPDHPKDLGQMLLNFRPIQLKFAINAFSTVQDLLRKTDLDKNKPFVDFVNQQLMITAQNKAEEVNLLFGATALCYTNFGNYYMLGGLINLVKPFVDYIQSKGNLYQNRTEVLSIERQENKFLISTSKGPVKARNIISGIPVNNLVELFPELNGKKKLKSKILGSERLNGAFTMGFGIKGKMPEGAIHRQLHHDGIGLAGSESIFISYAHPSDTSRAPEGQYVASVSTHVHNPGNNAIDKEAIAARITAFLKERGCFDGGEVVYQHASTPATWQDWTMRKYGFVGGYPQFRSIKPWQMISTRAAKGLYLCGDSVYPGQGIPGVSLNGIIAAKKLLADN